MTFRLRPNAGHPWTAEAGWDQLAVLYASPSELEKNLADWLHEDWHVWIRDPSGACALLYRPTGVAGEWRDLPLLGTPKERCIRLQIGDQVFTDFSGSITQHRVQDRKQSAISQTTCMLRVTPEVPGSAFVADDAEADIRQRGLPWMDAAWFRQVKKTTSNRQKVLP